MITISIMDSIKTNAYGFVHLINFYKSAVKHRDTTIHICIKNLKWIDANLSALFAAILTKLQKEKNLIFTMDLELAEKKFDVLIRNGFLQADSPIEDKQRSTLPARVFELNEDKEYINYLNEFLLNHRGFPTKYSELRESLIDQLIEIFCNSHYHSECQYPFFVCGQYYPQQKSLNLTLVDIGNGFFPRINRAEPEIKTDLQAVQWAIKGNSSKLKLEQVPGGLGLKGLINYCTERNGGVQIISGNAYWSTDDKNGFLPNGREIDNPLKGTTINLFFRG